MQEEHEDRARADARRAGHGGAAPGGYGSRAQEDAAFLDEQNRRSRAHTIDVCRCGAVITQCRCIGPHTPRVVQESCPKCRASTSSVGSRRITVELTSADIRKLIGAPSTAVVEAHPEVDLGPNGKTEARVVVSWREGT